MAAASIEGINIKIGADLSDLKEEMSATTDAIKGVGDSAKKDIAAANTPVEILKKNFNETKINAQRLADVCKDIAKSVGGFVKDSVSKAFELSPLTAAAWGELVDAFDGVKIALGQAVMPIIQELAPKITSLLTSISDFLTKHPDIARDIMGVATAITFISTVISTATPIAAAFGVTVGSISAPVLLLGAALIAAAYAWMHWDDICSWASEKWEALKTTLTGVIDAIKLKFDEWRTKINVAKANLISFKDSVVSKFESIKTSITDTFKSIDLLQAGRDFVAKIGAGIMEGINSIRDSVRNAFLSLIPDAVQQFFVSTDANFVGATADDPLGVKRRASGGPVIRGTPYLVGEVGPELFVPKINGYIVPNDELRETGMTNNFYIDGNIYGETYLESFVENKFAQSIRREIRLAA